MKKLLWAFMCSQLLVCSCDNHNDNDEGVVDTTLNDVENSNAQPTTVSNAGSKPSLPVGKTRPTRVSKSSRTDIGAIESVDTYEPSSESSVGPTRAAPVVPLRGLFSADDYPVSAQAENAQGIVQVRLTVGPDGRVSSCDLMRSSGNSALDAATCNILRRRARFTPARDANGNATTDTVTPPAIVWSLEG